MQHIKLKSGGQHQHSAERCE